MRGGRAVSGRRRRRGREREKEMSDLCHCFLSLAFSPAASSHSCAARRSRQPRPVLCPSPSSAPSEHPSAASAIVTVGRSRSLPSLPPLSPSSPAVSSRSRTQPEPWRAPPPSRRWLRTPTRWATRRRCCPTDAIAVSRFLWHPTRFRPRFRTPLPSSPPPLCAV